MYKQKRIGTNYVQSCAHTTKSLPSSLLQERRMHTTTAHVMSTSSISTYTLSTHT